MTRETALKVVLWAIALYHVFMGGGAFLSEGLARQLAHSVFGIELTLDPAMSFVVKVLGIYALIFGVFTLIAATNPVRYRVLLNVVVVLYLLRIINKLVFKTEYMAGLHIAPTRVWVESALLFGFALAVYVLRPRAEAVATR